MDEKDVDGLIKKRNEGWSIDELTIRYNLKPNEVIDILKSKTDINTFFSLNIDFKTKNPETIKMRMYSRIVELLNNVHAIYDVPSASQRFIILETPDKKIGIDIKVTYYDSVIKSAWRYKAYHKQVDHLYIIIISKRVTGAYLEKIKNDPTLPDNTTLISLEETENISKLQDMLMKLKFN